MTRKLKVAAAQVGAVHKTSDRSDTLSRLLTLLKDAASQGAQIVLFPELALTTFFPRYLFDSRQDLDEFFEHGEDITLSPRVKPLFDLAKELRVDLSVGFAERALDGTGYNSCVYYSATLGTAISKYRKIHLPGTKEPFPNKDAINQLEKRYFAPGDLGFKAFRAPGLLPKTLKKGRQEEDNSNEEKHTIGKGDPVLGMMICNDRRWPEAWRCYGLQGAELVLCGYNTNGYAPDLWGSTKSMSPEEAEKESLFHHRLVMQANSYMNTCFSISAARCGMDDGKFCLIGGSAIVSPQGHILVEAKGRGDEVVFAEVELEDCRQGKEMVGFPSLRQFVFSISPVLVAFACFGQIQRNGRPGVANERLSTDIRL